MNKKKLKYTYILRISIAIRCNMSKKTFFSMITLNIHTTNTTKGCRLIYYTWSYDGLLYPKKAMFISSSN